MTLSDRAAAAAPYARQLLDNRDVQASARQAAQATRAAYQRARGKDTAQIVKDKKFRQRVSEAAGALGRLWGATSEPPPKPKRRWPRLLIAILIGVAATVASTNESVRTRVRKLIGQNAQTESTTHDMSPTTSEPDSAA
jgi:hypothetical protein